ncbi:D-alanyl-D-alanine carboxypeptidase [Tetragenococcus koreensis]|uniref:serine-type D-Ala-D-Ala carboxypeptidase n=1 Tax=Tetragenococcus koreensis TaxID=290335 RepID=A0AAN4RJ84_9ENTE|nr:serine hydrolase [Tetragenococcus koreensis]AYW45309.1 D-alanyl-D-alanine carboxypeptidase [Tetragenococcus koreensis]MCF1586161.1 D-alanyl-D-alanine carboxypeptidase [Tetragenococcus koreensis]MCF1615733.1 D-alanyl-D-alanine carboxypeptidase [Tetragenococcus koreensis]MCF1618231.1 D-alanyl-D-alanine carboxypeptidase [Tetragenococcus koreensis]MCF1620692.1 D-alanyl-D-alanine carboxypeptidase [Tetragenococcus koreensis]
MNKKRFIPFVMGIIFLLFSLFSTTTVSAEDLDIRAEAAISVDYDTGKVFYEQDSDQPMGIASVTKLISLYLIEKEIQEGNLAWEDEVPISEDVAELSENLELSNVPLDQNESYTVQDLFEAAVIQSANAATIALAEEVAGSEEAFVNQMREQVEDWGIIDAKIVNSTGLSNEYLGDNIYPGTTKEDENELSAKDLAIVARNLLQDFPDILEVSRMPEKEFGEGTSTPFEMENFNKMLPGLLSEKEDVDGLKTGTTELAGACFVGTIEKDGNRIITVVLNATDHDDIENEGARFDETSKLMDYTFDHWKQETVLAKNDSIPEMPSVAVPQGKKQTLPVAAQDEISLWLPSDKTTDDVSYQTSLDNDEIQAPVESQTNIGTVQAQVEDDDLGYLDNEDGKSRSSSAIITTQGTEKANFFTTTWRNIKGFFSN